MSHLRRVWRTLHHPQHSAVFYSIFYVCATAAGVWVILVPVRTVEAEIGPTLVAVWGGYLVLGGLMGIVGATRAPRFWELAGLMCLLVGLGVYITTVWSMAVTGDLSATNRGTQAFILTGLLFLLVDRFIVVRKAEKAEALERAGCPEAAKLVETAA